MIPSITVFILIALILVQIFVYLFILYVLLRLIAWPVKLFLGTIVKFFDKRV